MSACARSETRRMNRVERIALAAAAALVVLSCARDAFGLEARLLKESFDAGLVQSGCPLSTNTDGAAANYRWYNVCSGYIWIFDISSQDEAVGVLFGGPEQPEVNDSNIVKRAITYWRNVVPNYSQTVDVLLDIASGDGCPDALWLQDLNLDPGLRWNCSEFAAEIPVGAEFLIVRGRHNGGAAPNFAFDGPFSSECAPSGAPRTFYYGINGSGCLPWVGPSGRSDNLLYWLILDRGAPNATQPSSWGAIKGLFR